MPPLADSPFYGAWIERDKQNRQAESDQLAQAMGAQKLVSGMRAQRQAEQERAEMERIKQLVSQSGGDPTKAIQALNSTGNLKAMKIAAELQRSLPPPPKAPEPYTLSPGAQRRGLDNEVLASNPAAAKEVREAKIVEMMRSAKIPEGSEKWNQILGNAIRKESNNAPPQSQVNVYSGSLTPAVNAQGESVFVQPSGREGTPPRVVEGAFPPERADQRKSKQVEKEGEATAQSVRDRIGRMGQIIQGGAVAGGVVGPLGVASKMVETVIGAAKPNTQTPAIDYENEQALLLADVRKLVEKDPNLSKDERDRLYQTLGGGFWQTPGSALRAMKNIVDYVESKKLTGPSRDTKLESTIRGAGWDYEPSKYDYRIVDGKAQRKLK